LEEKLMAELRSWSRPATLIPGAAYLWMRIGYGQAPPETASVRFLSYDNCPAFAIIATPAGGRQRCPRDELYEPGLGREGRPVLEASHEVSLGESLKENRMIPY
jgi:hypothetical protein